MYNPNRRLTRPIAAALLRVAPVVSFGFAVGSAAADDLAIEPPAPPRIQPVATTPAAPFDVFFNIALTSDYVSRGMTNSDSKPALQGYIEPRFGIAYLNVWSSNVDYGEGFEGAEIDVAGGIRPEFGPLTLDLGYAHYFYAPKHVGPDYGELFARADYNFNDKFTIGGRVYFAPNYNQSGSTATWLEGAIVVPLSKEFSVSGGLGYQFFQDSSAFEQLAWNAGISYKWKQLTVDLRYWDTNLTDNECVVRSGFASGCGSRVVGTLSLDTSWSAVRDWASGK